MKMVSHDYIRDRIRVSSCVLRANFVHEGVVKIREIGTPIERDGSDEIDVSQP